MKKEINPVTVCAVLLGAFLTVFLCADSVNQWVYSRAKTEKVTFTTYGQESDVPLQIVDNFIYETGDPRVVDDAVPESEHEKYLYAQKKDAIYSSQQMDDALRQNASFRRVQQQRAGQQVIRYNAYAAGDEISFELPVYPSTCISIAKNGTPLSLLISRDTNPDGDWIDSTTFEKEEHQYSQKIYFYDFPDYAYIYLYYMVAYLGIFFAAVVAIVLLWKVGGLLQKRDTIFSKSQPGISFAVIFVLLSVALWIGYWRSPDTFHVTGAADAYYYAHPEQQSQFLDASGAFSLQLFVQNCWPHRSYLTLLVYYMMNLLSGALHLDESLLHLAFNAVLVATASAVAALGLYRTLTGKQATNVQMYLFAGLYTFYWRSHLFYTLTDLPGAVFALIALWQWMELLKHKRIRNAVCFGLAGTLAVLYRASYAVMLKLGILLLAVCWMVNLWRKKQKISFRVLGKGLARFAVILLISAAIMLPQGYINWQKGHVGLMPYASAGTYNLSKNDLSTPQWGSLMGYEFGKVTHQDAQLNHVMDALVTDDMQPALPDAVWAVAANPIGMIVAIIKKLLYAVSAYQEGIYHYLVENRNAAFDTMQYLLNYFLLGNVVYYCFVKKNSVCPTSFRWMLSFCFVFQVVSQVGLFHIERRFFLLFFLLIYFFNAFFLQRCYQEDLCEPERQVKISNQGHYLAFIFFFMVLSYTMLLTIELNFT